MKIDPVGPERRGLAMGFKEAALRHGFVERFVAVDDGAYDDIRAMLAAIHAAGYTVPR